MQTHDNAVPEGQAALLLCICLKTTLSDITPGVASRAQQLCTLNVMSTLLAL